VAEDERADDGQRGAGRKQPEPLEPLEPKSRLADVVGGEGQEL
jgi:hypothetical protein